MNKQFVIHEITLENVRRHFQLFSAFLDFEQRIFYMSDPVKRAVSEKKNTPEEILHLLVGRPGFEDYAVRIQGAPRHFLCTVLSPDGSDIYAGCQFILKRADVVVGEIWSVISNPNYIRSGAVAFMILSIFNEFHKLSTNGYIMLSVATTNFPFISFYDRLMLYGRYGFKYPMGDVFVVDNQGNYTTANLRMFEFKSPFVRGAMDDNTYVTYEEQRVTLHDFKQLYPFIHPTQLDGTPIRFISEQITDMNMEKVRTVIHSLGRQDIKTINTEIPQKRLSYLSHSAYVLSDNRQFITATRVPDNVEVVIINSIGHSITDALIKVNWNMAMKYLNYLPIQQIQALYPGFKIPSGHGIPVDDPVKFFECISNGLINVFGDTSVQIHAYNTGDLCPNVLFALKNFGPLQTREAFDIASPVFGVYDIENVPQSEYKKVQWKSDPRQFLNLEYKVPVDLVDVAYALGSPDQHMKTYPRTDAEFERMYDALEEVRRTRPTEFGRVSFVSGTLANMFQRQRFLEKTRIYVFSCGDIGDERITAMVKGFPLPILNSQIIKHETIGGYRFVMNRMGEILYNLYNSAGVPDVISPASYVSDIRRIENRLTRRAKKATKKWTKKSMDRGTKKASRIHMTTREKASQVKKTAKSLRQTQKNRSKASRQKIIDSKRKRNQQMNAIVEETDEE